MKRLALVIGVATYRHLGKLQSPTNDAVQMASQLRQAGFTVMECHRGATMRFEVIAECKKAQLESALRLFAGAVKEAGRGGPVMAFVYFSGHGMTHPRTAKHQILAEDYDPKLDTGGITLEEALKDIIYYSHTVIAVIDACRSAPFSQPEREAGLSNAGKREVRHTGTSSSAASASPGVQNKSAWSSAPFTPTPAVPEHQPASEPEKNVVVCWACGAGEVVADGGQGTLGPYTTILLKYLFQPGVGFFTALTLAHAKANMWGLEPEYSVKQGCPPDIPLAVQVPEPATMTLRNRVTMPDDALVAVGTEFVIMDEHSKTVKSTRGQVFAELRGGCNIRKVPVVDGRTWWDRDQDKDAYAYLRLLLVRKADIVGGRCIVGGYATHGKTGSNQQYTRVPGSMWGTDVGSSWGAGEFYSLEGCAMMWTNLHIVLGDAPCVRLADRGPGATTTLWARGIKSWVHAAGKDQAVDFTISWK